MNPTEALRRMLDQMELENKSQRTMNNYLEYAEKFLVYVQEHKVAGEKKELAEYLREWALALKWQKYKASSINLQVDAARYLCGRVFNTAIPKVVVPRMKLPKVLPRIHEQAMILQAISKEHNLKHRLILSLIYGCGLRLGEVQNLQIRNILREFNTVHIEYAKGSKHRVVSIPESMRALLYEYIAGRSVSEYVFLGADRVRPLSERSIGKIVKNAFVRIGANAHPHMLRACFATHQIMSGQNLFDVQDMMGHSDLKTTKIYYRLSEAQQRKSTDLLVMGN